MVPRLLDCSRSRDTATQTVEVDDERRISNLIVELDGEGSYRRAGLSASGIGVSFTHRTTRCRMWRRHGSLTRRTKVQRDGTTGADCRSITRPSAAGAGPAAGR